MPGSPVQTMNEPGDVYDAEGRCIGHIEQATASMSSCGETTLEVSIVLNAYSTELSDALNQGQLVVTIGTVEALTQRIADLERAIAERTIADLPAELDSDG